MTVHDIADRAWGLTEPVPVAWSRGAWSAEIRGDELAELRWNGVAVLRSLRVVARDPSWGTVPVQSAQLRETDAGLEIGIRLVGLGADLDGKLLIEVDGDSLAARAAVHSRRAWQRARLGLVVLHPATHAGARLLVTHPDGTHEQTRLPVQIAPHQPAMDIEGLAWEQAGLHVEAVFRGEVFEMEDQRNWTDASFKSYSTPLARPYPVAVAAGESIEHELALTVTGIPQQQTDPVPELSFVASDAVFPAVGLAASTEAGAPREGQPAAAFHLLEIDLAGPDWRAALRAGCDAAAASGVPVDVRFITDTPALLGEAVQLLVGRPVIRLGVTHSRRQVTEPELWSALREAAVAEGLDALLTGGSRSHFTELNRRHHELPAELPSLSFALTPQMHARERAQLIESIPMQRLVVQDALRIAAGRPVHVGPVTLRPRYLTTAPGSDGPVPAGIGYRVAADADDPRQRSEALAAWTVASAAALAVPGVASICYFETWGPRGIADAAGVFPVASAIDTLAGLAGARLLRVVGERPEGAHVLATEQDGHRALVAASLHAEPVRLRLAEFGVLELPPFSVVVRSV